MNRIKNKLSVLFRRELHSYNPIENVFQWLADYYLVLSPNFDSIITNGKVTSKRKLIYYTNFAIELAVLIKYTILATYGDPYTVAVLGESFHYLANIYFVSTLYLSIQLTIVPIVMQMSYISDRGVAKILVTISRFDNNRVINRINHRKVTMKLWLMNKMAAIILMQSKWIIFPLVILYGAISVYIEQGASYNLATLVINSIFLWISTINIIGKVAIYSAISICKGL